ncbi:hypothetical protein [Escherichia coli]|uniref:hypothetical protein n=1 Tax=Escherichia coli TaxID=562 RepID=UPI00388D3527
MLSAQWSPGFNQILVWADRIRKAFGAVAADAYLLRCREAEERRRQPQQEVWVKTKIYAKCSGFMSSKC